MSSIRLDNSPASQTEINYYMNIFSVTTIHQDNALQKI